MMLRDASVEEGALVRTAWIKSTRRTAVLVGLLFLIATATFYTAHSLIAGVLTGADYLTGASAHTNALTAAALLAFVDTVAVMGIAVFLYPLLKGFSQPLALGYIALRVGELAAVLLYLAVPLLVIEVSDALFRGDVQASALRPLGALFRAQYQVTLVVVFLVTAGAGTILATLLYRSRLIPRWIAMLGLIGYPVMLVGTVLYMFDLIDMLQGAGTAAAAPVGLFELILPIWLIARGFNEPADL